MRRHETTARLDALARAERVHDFKTLGVGLLACLLVTAFWFMPGEISGTAQGTVTWSEIVHPDEAGEPFSRMLVQLSDGRRVEATSARTPPPVPGEAVDLRVRRTWYGYTTYGWIRSESAR